MKTLPVQEIFGPTIQGEGGVIGQKTLFVRFAGCDYQCSWCDSKFTWKKDELAPITFMTPAEIRDRLLALPGGATHVSISGGNPALHDLAELIDLLHAAGFVLNTETQGSLAPAWFADMDLVTFSPKPPSSGMATDWDKLAAGMALAKHPFLKVVIFDDVDYAYAVEVRRRFPAIPLALQVGNLVGMDDPGALIAKLLWLVDKVALDRDLPDVRVLPQLHVLLWGNKRGV